MEFRELDFMLDFIFVFVFNITFHEHIRIRHRQRFACTQFQFKQCKINMIETELTKLNLDNLGTRFSFRFNTT